MALLALASLMFGCATGPDPLHSADARDQPAPRSADVGAAAGPVSTVIDARPVALVDGRRVTWGELRPLLNELGGAQILEEYVLDRRLAERAKEAGLVIDEDDLVRERRLLLELLSDDPNVALRLLEELRSRQGLGELRFDALMRRNATLRALVQSEIAITPAAVDHVFERSYGERRQARLIVVPSLQQAQQALDEVRANRFFGDAALEMSTDYSAARGGLLEPISRADPSYPEALRRTLWSLSPGETSAPILLDRQYAIVRMEEIFPARGISLDEVRGEVVRATTLEQERLAMDALARSLVANVTVNVFDQELSRGWTRRRNAARAVAVETRR